MRVLFGVVVAALVAVGCNPGADQARGEEDFSRYAPIAEAIEKADRVILHEGLPRSFDEPDLYERELKENRTIELLGYRFYDYLVPLEPEQYKPLAEQFTRGETFIPYGGAKTCGGFHPDYALEWHSGGEVFYSLVCFGCHEMIAVGPGTRVKADISEKGYAELRELLNQYQKRRPISNEFISPIWTSFRNAKAAAVFSGIPRGVKMPPSAVVKFEQHEMYKDPKPLAVKDKEALESFLNSGPFRNHEPKKCVFHADFAIAWMEKEVQMAWLVCFGCSEVKFFTGDDEIYLDLTESSDKALEAILAKYK